MNSRIGARIGGAIVAIVLALAVSGCVAPISREDPAPVQEMSDARQAIQSAKSAGSARYTPQTLQEAERLLAQATRDLNRGEYVRARMAALSAKRHAIVAREATLRVNSPPN
ncbi:DUF4398 domain-containing protein [Ectothiorhodospiraceae bacterium WFHF3C12]|nr:DUF4398 domain-containing protein [Ectothiorhodospiraceae bacterium WFHF3C12]